MQSGNNTGQAAEQSRQRWLQVCKTRGTPAPDPAQVARFLASLPQQVQAALDQALLLCLNGREKQGELATLSWAAACTRPAFVARVQAHGLACTGPDLFGAGLALMASGWDMSARVAQLAHHPEDIASLRTMLALQAQTGRVEVEEVQEVQEVQAGALPAAAGKIPPVQAAWPEQAPGPPPWPEPPEWLEPPDPAWEDWKNLEDGMNKPWPMRAVHAVEVEIKPEPSESQAPALGSQGLQEKAHLGMVNRQERLQVRLFGREAAHTLEIGPHRRGDSFMGVQVVTVESARALASGGYDWGRKLTVQLTPEEMPAAIAVLMNLSSSARFGQHGVDRDKFVELRRQEGGLVVVTGQAGSVHAVPVRTATLYYLLSLFARAMARGLPGNSIADVLALVKASQ